MLTPRVMPCLLFKDNGLVKTIQFKKPNYVGDPINAIKIYNEKEVDELIFLDITATRNHHQPRFDVIEKIASECFMPLCYGGGITTVEEISKIFYLGVEKVAISTAAYLNLGLISEAASLFGNQSIVGVIDVKRNLLGKPEVWIGCGEKNTHANPVEYAIKMEKAGAGEILVNSIDRDGTYSGYDIGLIKEISSNISIPTIASGGAGGLIDLRRAVKEGGASACAIGSMAVYSGKGLGVLINFPSPHEIENIFK
jgi:cyclase